MDKLKQKTENKKQNKDVPTSNNSMGISGTEIKSKTAFYLT